MLYETATGPHSPLANELRALVQEHHSPSSAAIHAALLISARTEVGYGEIYTVIPRAEGVYFASLAAQEMEARCPFLLAVIRDAITANRNRLSIEVLFNREHIGAERTAKPRSAHARMSGIPRLTAWLLGQHKDASIQDPS